MNKVLPSLFKFLEYSPVILAAVLPLLFVPLTTEYFETAKVTFLYIFTSLVFITWAIKMVYEKRVSLVKSPLDLAFALMAIVFALVAIFSPNKYLALFGSYLRFEPGLIFVLCLVVLFYTFSSNLKNKAIRELTVICYVLSVAAAAALALLAYLGVFSYLPLPVSLAFLGSRTFNTVGSLGTLSVLAGLAFILGMSLLSDSRSQRAPAGYRSAVPGVWNYVTYGLNVALSPLLAIILVYSTPAGWVTLVVGLLFLVIFEASIIGKLKTVLAPLAIWAVLLLVAIYTPVISGKLNLTRPAEVNLPLEQSWQIASQVITVQPLFGAGLGQFPQLYTTLKPLSLNSTNLWNLRFDRPFNELILVLAEAGLLGLLAYLFVFYKAGQVVFALKNREPLAAGLGAAILALFAGYFVTVSGVLLSFSLILFLSLLVSMEEEAGSKLAERVILMVSAIKDKLFGAATAGLTGSDPKSVKSGMTQILPYIFLVVAVLSGLSLTVAAGLGYLAEYYNRLALNAVAKNDGRAAYNNEAMAISFNPYADVYQRNLAQLTLGIAVNISSRPQVSDADKQTIQGLIQEAIRRVRIASEIINPGAVANWETRAQVYQGLIGVAQGAEQWTVDSYAQAISLDPTNPNLRVLLGGVYFGMKNYDLAANSFAQAINLKSDLANSHYNLAQAFLMLKQNANALSQYDVVLNLIGTGSPDYAQAKKERDAVAKLAAEEAAASANTSTPSTGSTGSLQAGTQPALTTPPPTTPLKKQNVAPLNLGTPKEASPAAGQ